MLSIIFLKNEQVQKGEIVPQIIQKKNKCKIINKLNKWFKLMRFYVVFVFC